MTELPAVLRYATELYNGLWNLGMPATEFPLAEDLDIPPDKRVFVGAWTRHVYGDKAIPNPEGVNWTSQNTHAAMAFLKRAGCVSILQRGNRDRHSIIVFHYPPTLSLWERGGRVTIGPKHSKLNVLRQEIADLRKRVENLERGQT